MGGAIRHFGATYITPEGAWPARPPPPFRIKGAFLTRKAKPSGVIRKPTSTREGPKRHAPTRKPPAPPHGQGRPSGARFSLSASPAPRCPPVLRPPALAPRWELEGRQGCLPAFRSRSSQRRGCQRLTRRTSEALGQGGGAGAEKGDGGARGWRSARGPITRRLLHSLSQPRAVHRVYLKRCWSSKQGRVI